MTNPINTQITPAINLKEGDQIRLMNQITTINLVNESENWVELFFIKPVWDALNQKWLYGYGCYPGFCIEKL